MRKIFIDCGAHKATTASVVLERFKDFQVHSFETNPEFFHYFDGLNIFLHKKAVWIHNKSINFFPAENSYGGSLFKDKKTGNIIQEPIKVDCVDLSNWIIENFELDDYIILKLNVEGSEYEILNKMVKDGSIFYINELYVDFHYDKIKSISRGIHNKLISKLNQLNINLYLWGEPNKALDYKTKPKKVKPQFRNYLENPKLVNDKLKKIKQYVKNPHRIKKKILSYFKI